MTDSMKFGPEWLRNLSGDGCNTGGGGGGSSSILTAPRYQLAEHRYGREEMLALFDRNYKPPEHLVSFPALYIVQAQQPLALTPMTEEEARSWNSGLTNNVGRGRGASVDRGGRGRGGRGGIYPTHYSRSALFDEPGDGVRTEPQSFQGRSRPFDRSQSERGWSERNGVPEPGDWNGSTSPRKESGRGGTGGSFMEGNWRRQRAGEEDDGWRVASSSRGEKWVRSSWRDGGGNERGDRLDSRPDGVEGEEVRSGTRWEHRASHRASHDLSNHPQTRALRTWEPNHHDNAHDNLPEWATENPSESGGSFDASGAFHGGMYSDDDEDGIISAGGNRETRIRHMSEGNNLSNSSKSSKSLSHIQGQQMMSNHQRQQRNNSTIIINNNNNNNGNSVRERPKSLQPFDDKEESQLHEEEQQDVNVKRSVNSPPKSISITPNNTPVKSSPIQQPLGNSLSRKVQSATNLDKVINTEKNNSAGNNQMLKQNCNKSSTGTGEQDKLKDNERRSKTPVVAVDNDNNKPPPLHSELRKSKSTLGMMSSATNVNVRQKSEDDLDRMKEEANALVAKLMADEEIHKDQRSNQIQSSNQVKNQVQGIPNPNGQEKWFYRDPQDEVQGPFLASEMSEWFKAGYFNVNLLVKRACDERYSMLGHLIKMWGRVPFMPGPPVPPLKVTEPVAIPVPVGIPGALPKGGIDDPMVLYQYQQMWLLQNQMVFRHVRSSVVAKLSQSEQWASMSPAEQNQLIIQHMLQQPEMAEISPIAVNPFVPPLAAQPAANPIMQLFTQMQQAKTQNENHLPPAMHPPTPTHAGTIDPVQQLIQQMGGMQNLHGIQQPNITQTPNNTPEDNPIKSLLRQLNVNGHPNPTQMESVWPHPPPQIAPPQFANPNWQTQMGPIPAMPPGQLPNSLWDLHTKEMKTEQQILEEQKLRIQEEKKKEQQQQLLKKQEELERQQVAEEEKVKRKQEEEVKKLRLAEEEEAAASAAAAAAAKRTEEDRKKKEEEKRRIKEEEKRKHEEEAKKKEEKKRKEEERKREEKRKQDEENNRKKQEEEKRKREEAKRQEEKLRKEEEKRKKLEDEQKREEEERIKKEEEARRKAAEAEEQAKRAEQRRREAEALKKLQERSKAPWAQTPHVPPPSSHSSLAEIQRLEREKKAEELRVQQLMQQQLAQQRAAEIAQEAAAAEISKGLQLKWAEKAAPASKPMVKSLAQIQQEEQERLAKVKQQERERQEKAAQKEPVVALQSVGIWGTAAQSLNWTSSTTSANNQAWSSSNTGTAGGFWDDPTPQKTNLNSKQSAKQSTTVKTSVNTIQQQLQQQQQQQQNNNKATKSKNKKDEELVKKLFEQNTAKPDDFNQWCNKALGGLQVSVDIPTFVGFLRDIESAYEVKEYVRLYLGDNKQCSEFAKQFLEKRSKWRSAQRPHPQADDLCKPAPAVNPNATTTTEFQEVKGKAKKPKKGKMFKVDSRILGFSVTAAPDRINVGDRDYGEGV